MGLFRPIWVYSGLFWLIRVYLGLFGLATRIESILATRIDPNRIFSGLFGSIRVGNLNRLKWVYSGLFRSIRAHLGLLGSIWVYSDLFGSIRVGNPNRIYSGLFGLATRIDLNRIYLGSFGFGILISIWVRGPKPKLSFPNSNLFPADIEVEEGGRRLISSSDLRVLDPDTKPEMIRLQITRSPRHGKLHKRRAPASFVTGSDAKGGGDDADGLFDDVVEFTFEDILRQRISYSHDGSETNYG